MFLAGVSAHNLVRCGIDDLHPRLAPQTDIKPRSGFIEHKAIRIAAILDLDVHPIPAAKGEPDHAHFDVRYAAVTRLEDEARADEAESLGLAWLPLAEAARRMDEPGARRALAKAARLLGVPS
jgi:hypothetical protein